MAKEIDIKLKPTADTSGVQTVSSSLKRLKSAAINKPRKQNPAKQKKDNHEKPCNGYLIIRHRTSFLCGCHDFHALIIR